MTVNGECELCVYFGEVSRSFTAPDFEATSWIYHQLRWESRGQREIHLRRSEKKVGSRVAFRSRIDQNGAW